MRPAQHARRILRSAKGPPAALPRAAVHVEQQPPQQLLQQQQQQQQQHNPLAVGPGARAAARPTRCKWLLELEGLDPEAPASHAEVYGHDAGSAGGRSGAALPLAYQPMTAPHLTPSMQQGSPDPTTQQLRRHGGFIGSRQQVAQLLRPLAQPTARASLGLGPEFEDEFLQGPDYRYAVDEAGQVVDMVAQMRELPKAFDRVRQPEPVATRSRGPSVSSEGPAPADAADAASGGQHMAQPKVASREAAGRRGAGQRGGYLAGEGGGGGSDAYLDDGGPRTRARAAMQAPLAPAGSFEARRSLVAVSVGQPTSGRGRAANARVVRVPPGLVLKVFAYCIGPTDLFQGLWDLELLEQVQFVQDIEDADVVVHRRPLPGEKQFAYNSFRSKAQSRGIPFVSLWDGSAAEVRQSLLPVFALYAGLAGPDEVSSKGSLAARGQRAGQGNRRGQRIRL